jgi:DNA-binding beta-propeller fold protein YncE
LSGCVRAKSTQEIIMSGRLGPAITVLAVLVVVAKSASTQTVEPTNSAPNPYHAIYDWAKMPEGRSWGSTAGVDIDPDGTSVWVFERCGAFALPSELKPGEPFACDGSNLAPILKFDASGKLVASFGAGMFVLPHGIRADRAGNVWVADALGREGKGHQVFKFGPDGKLLMRLGKAGVAGAGPDEFNAPSAVLIAPNGDVFVADGHGGNTNARIVKFSPDGKFIKAWGKKGSAPGEFDTPHTLAMDSQGRLFVGDRQNNRIQIFDQDGNFIDQLFQFSRPSGVFIDAGDTIYVADSESESVSKNHDGWKRGIRIGKIADGRVAAFIPDPAEKATTTSSAEGVAADKSGNIFGAEAGSRRLVKYVKN